MLQRLYYNDEVYPYRGCFFYYLTDKRQPDGLLSFS
jgi:hypothetical protein